MKFIVQYGGILEEKLLIYIPEEHSFNMAPIISKVDFELMLNKLTLSVVNNKIIQLWGFCGLDNSMNTNFKAPDFKSGALKVEDTFKHGFAYGINEKDLAVFVNIKTGWVCIGNPETKNNAVEFVKNCVAVVDNESRLVSLWLRPASLPSAIRK